mmetsp:Transcript_11884/g.24218  ORF Transcript_11884/g.24218 Transcript_11884/m.24218 type:complete len:87 (+) Transcript_11884:372-632(+)
MGDTRDTIPSCKCEWQSLTFLSVEAIDPSSPISRGSLLGDRTRMQRLAVHPRSFVRPSPAGGTLGGVARRTDEVVTLCEAVESKAP